MNIHAAVDDKLTSAWFKNRTTIFYINLSLKKVSQNLTLESKVGNIFSTNVSCFTKFLPTGLKNKSTSQKNPQCILERFRILVSWIQCLFKDYLLDGLVSFQSSFLVMSRHVWSKHQHFSMANISVSLSSDFSLTNS